MAGLTSPDLRLLSGAVLAATPNVFLTALDRGKISQGWGSPQVDKSVRGQPLSNAGRKFGHGRGMHAPMTLSREEWINHQTAIADFALPEHQPYPPGKIGFSGVNSHNHAWVGRLLSRNEQRIRGMAIVGVGRIVFNRPGGGILAPPSRPQQSEPLTYHENKNCHCPDIVGVDPR